MSALADATLRTFSAAGVLLGLLWGIHHEPHVVCTDNHGAAAGVLGRCFNHVALTLGTHWGLALCGGALVGACSGLVLAKLMRTTAQLAN